MPKLHAANGGLEGTTFHLLERRITVGRTGDNLIQINDSTVSKHHAVLLWEGNGYKLQDLGSTNGTRLNGEPVTEVQLNNGDTVAFGDIELRYEAPVGKAARAVQQAVSSPLAGAPPIPASPGTAQPAAISSTGIVASPPSDHRPKIVVRVPGTSGPPPLPKPPPLPNK